MEVGPITPAQAAEKALAAWAAVVEAINADESAAPDAVPVAPAAVPGDAQAQASVHNETSVPVSEPALPGADSDQGHEVATLQSLWRPPIPAAEAPRVPPTAIADVPAAQADFALPNALLTTATLTGLRTEPAMTWSLPTPSSPWQPPPQPALRRRRERTPSEPRREPPRQEAGSDPAHAPRPREQAPAAPQTVIDADDDGGDWCESLSRGLQAQLAQPLVPPALLSASEQWQRGRCVVLACPQRSDPAGPAWAYVLWPRQQMQATGKVALHGLRVEARLQWLNLPPALPWCHARLIREHHPRHGRQMVMADNGAAAQGEVQPCAVQLGPLLEPLPRRCEVRVRVPAAQRFWAALGTQWSVHVVVCAWPLLATPPRFTEATPC